MIQLRTARFEDHIAIAQLHAASWQATYRGIYSDAFLDSAVKQDRLVAWYKRLQSPAANQWITVAELNQEIVGFACLFFHDDPAFGTLLDNLHVAPHIHNKGIGSLLIGACINVILDKSPDPRLYLWVYEKNTNAIGAYIRWGGIHYETVLHENVDGTTAMACRFVWNDVMKMKITQHQFRDL